MKGRQTYPKRIIKEISLKCKRNDKVESWIFRKKEKKQQKYRKIQHIFFSS